MFLFYLHECFKFLERKGFPGSRPRDDDIVTQEGKGGRYGETEKNFW